MKDLTVIIVTRNSPYIDKCLRSLCKQDPEVIVFLNGYNDPKNYSYEDRLKKYSVKIIKTDWFNYSRAANEGIKISTKNNVAIIDDDMVVCEGWVNKVIDHLKETEILHGSIWYVPGGTKTSLYFSKMWNRDMNTKKHLIDPNLAFRKTIIKKIGYFDEEINAYTWDLYKRTCDEKIKINYFLEIPVIHLQVHSLKRLIKTYFNYGKFQRRFFNKYHTIHQPISALKNILFLTPICIYETIKYRSLAFALFYRLLRFSKSLGFLLGKRES